MQLGEHGPEMLERPQAAGHPAVGHERGGLGLPLGPEEVEELLQRGREAVVVLGRDDDERVGIGESRLHRGHALERGGPVAHRDVELVEVDHVDRDVDVVLGLADEPVRDHGGEPSFARAGDDDGDAEWSRGC